jgi:integrase
MPRPRLPFLQIETTRHGRVVYFVRFGKGPRVRIHGDYGSAEFMAAYRAALEGAAPPGARPEKDAKSLAWLIARYRETALWAMFSPATKRQREAILRQVIDRAGSKPFEAIEKRHIQAGVDERRFTPHQANHFLKVMRHLFSWAAGADHIEADPTQGVAFVKAKTTGHHTWTADEIAAFETHWPIGTRQRLAMAILLYTGLRRGDAVRLGRQHIGKDGRIRLTTEKTGEGLDLPLAPALAEIIEKTPTADLALISTATGDPMTKAGFGNWFKEACIAAGVPGTAHGLRKALATMAAEGGASETELEALFGWKDRETSSIYTKTASRKKQADEAMRKAFKGQKVNDPAPHLGPESPHPKNTLKKTGV